MVVPGLWDAKWPTFFGQEDLKVKKVPGVLHEARGGKQMILSHPINIWTYSELTLKGIWLNTPGKGPGKTLNIGSFHCFAL